MWDLLNVAFSRLAVKTFLQSAAKKKQVSSSFCRQTGRFFYWGWISLRWSRKFCFRELFSLFVGSADPNFRKGGGIHFVSFANLFRFCYTCASKCYLTGFCFWIHSELALVAGLCSCVLVFFGNFSCALLAQLQNFGQMTHFTACAESELTELFNFCWIGAFRSTVAPSKSAMLVSFVH